MTRLLDNIDQIAGQFQALVFDQWGVLHDGTAPYPGAVEALSRLAAAGHRLAVLSNSGKRADLNAARIEGMGFPRQLFRSIMTSGEALWDDAVLGKLPGPRAFIIAASPADAAAWATGLDLWFASSLAEADFVLLMGLPEGKMALSAAALKALRDDILAAGLPVFCSNPDRASPRAGGALALSPGALAHSIAEEGGAVTFYGKPHLPVFRAVEAALDTPPDHCLMIGDSLEHDIQGAHAAGWRTVFVRGGIHAGAFQCKNTKTTLAALVASHGTPSPDFSLETLR